MRKKLLLADDSITIQKVVELTFPAEEFQVVTAGNGRLAIEKAAAFLPDIVLCDVIMPQLDGYQVCEALRAMPELRDVPIGVRLARDRGAKPDVFAKIVWWY